MSSTLDASIDPLLTISIVTPSFNQGEFLDEAMRSVLDQGYPALEYVVMDGGSSDDSVEVIKRHEGRLTHWTSGRDAGQYDAIARGFSKTSGEVMGWLNSDDKYTPWAFAVVADIFASFPEVQWLTTLHPLEWDARGRAVWVEPPRGFAHEAFLAGEHLPISGQYGLNFIQQESTFWRRSLWEKAGAGFDLEYKQAGDFDLWARFFKHAELYAVTAPLGGFRFHGAQKTGDAKIGYMKEAERILERAGGRRAGAAKRLLRAAATRLSDMPGSSLLLAAGLLHKCKICRFDHRTRAWAIENRYV